MNEQLSTPNTRKKPGLIKGAIAALAIGSVFAGLGIAKSNDAPRQETVPTAATPNATPTDVPERQKVIKGVELTPKPVIEAPVQHTQAPEAESTNPTDTSDFARDPSKQLGNDAVEPHTGGGDFDRDPSKNLGDDAAVPHP